MNYKNIKSTILLFCLLGSAVFHINAQVTLPFSDLGLTSINDGVAGPAHLYESYLGSLNASEFHDADGNAIPGDNSLNAFFWVNHYASISKKPSLLKGFPVWEVLLPTVVNIKLEGLGGIDENRTGLGDAIIGVGLQWPNNKLFGKTFFHRFLLNAVVPIGTYDKDKPVNIGANVWSIMPYYAFTLYWDEASKWETSMRLRYQWNSKNNDVAFGEDAQPGQAAWMNYSVSYEAAKNFRIGVAGYYLQQLSDHQINGVELPDSKERAFSVGPGFFYQHKSFLFRLTGAFDVMAENRFVQKPFINFTLSKVWLKQ